MIHRFIPFLLLIASCASADVDQGPLVDAAPATKYDPRPIPLIYQETDSSALVFEDGTRMETGLYDLRYIGQVQRHGGMPWLIMAGRHCTECDAELALYIHSPSDGALQVANGANARYYPGRILDGETGDPYYEGRVFYGEVLAETGGVIWFERIHQADGTVQEVTTLMDLDGEIPVEQQFMDQERLSKTLELAARGACTEIPGIDQTAAP